MSRLRKEAIIASEGPSIPFDKSVAIQKPRFAGSSGHSSGRQDRPDRLLKHLPLWIKAGKFALNTIQNGLR